MTSLLRNKTAYLLNKTPLNALKLITRSNYYFLLPECIFKNL